MTASQANLSQTKSSGKSRSSQSIITLEGSHVKPTDVGNRPKGRKARRSNGSAMVKRKDSITSHQSDNSQENEAEQLDNDHSSQIIAGIVEAEESESDMPVPLKSAKYSINSKSSTAPKKTVKNRNNKKTGSIRDSGRAKGPASIQDAEDPFILAVDRLQSSLAKSLGAFASQLSETSNEQGRKRTLDGSFSDKSAPPQKKQKNKSNSAKERRGSIHDGHRGSQHGVVILQSGASQSVSEFAGDLFAQEAEGESITESLPNPYPTPASKSSILPPRKVPEKIPASLETASAFPKPLPTPSSSILPPRSTTTVIMPSTRTTWKAVNSTPTPELRDSPNPLPPDSSQDIVKSQVDIPVVKSGQGEGTMLAKSNATSLMDDSSDYSSEESEEDSEDEGRDLVQAFVQQKRLAESASKAKAPTPIQASKPSPIDNEKEDLSSEPEFEPDSESSSDSESSVSDNMARAPLVRSSADRKTTNMPSKNGDVSDSDQSESEISAQSAEENPSPGAHPELITEETLVSRDGTALDSDARQESTEEPVEEPMEAPIQGSMDEPTEEPLEGPSEEPSEESSEEPVEESLETPVERSAEEPVEELVEEPMEEPRPSVQDDATAVPPSSPELEQRTAEDESSVRYHSKPLEEQPESASKDRRRPRKSGVTPKPKKKRLAESTPVEESSRPQKLMRTDTPQTGASLSMFRIPGSKGKPGKTTATELQAISRALDTYKDAWGASEEHIISLIHGTAFNSEAKEFWKHVAAAAPNLPIRNVRETCRRNFHNFDARGHWTDDQDDELRTIHARYPGKWKMIGAAMNRFPEDCRDRWKNYLICGDKIGKGNWEPAEEDRLILVVKECLELLSKEQRSKNAQKGDTGSLENQIDWNTVSEKMGHTRSRLQCFTKWNRIKDKPTEQPTPERAAGSSERSREIVEEEAVSDSQPTRLSKPATNGTPIVETEDSIAETSEEDVGNESYIPVARRRSHASKYKVQDSHTKNDLEEDHNDPISDDEIVYESRNKSPRKQKAASRPQPRTQGKATSKDTRAHSSGVDENPENDDSLDEDKEEDISMQHQHQREESIDLGDYSTNDTSNHDADDNDLAITSSLDLNQDLSAAAALNGTLNGGGHSSNADTGSSSPDMTPRLKLTTAPDKTHDSDPNSDDSDSAANSDTDSVGSIRATPIYRSSTQGKPSSSLGRMQLPGRKLTYI
ncbi:hypothetical protein F5884DRAFT_761608 [Xylogone sp. PMI_703]|nr:hypothetical protein F5884DRAFT_761608 [Xylogone sp. PMI_703]